HDASSDSPPAQGTALDPRRTGPTESEQTPPVPPPPPQTRGPASRALVVGHPSVQCTARLSLPRVFTQGSESDTPDWFSAVHGTALPPSVLCNLEPKVRNSRVR